MMMSIAKMHVMMAPLLCTWCLQVLYIAAQERVFARVLEQMMCGVSASWGACVSIINVSNMVLSLCLIRRSRGRVWLTFLYQDWPQFRLR